LRERTPPPPPVLTGLKARNRAILVQWVAPPVQDLFGFIVVRSEGPGTRWRAVGFVQWWKEEKRWKQVDSLQFPETFGCEDIPSINTRVEDTIFSFLDTTVTPKKTYWYGVIGAEYGGNKGDTSAPIETYTYDFTCPPKPTILSVTESSEKCALKITWNPPYDTLYLGFVVFRSSNKNCCYQQISPIIKGNEFVDDKVIAGMEYWYKIQYFNKEGNRSLPSDPQSGKIIPK
jgi:hypothetical protein